MKYLWLSLAFLSASTQFLSAQPPERNPRQPALSNKAAQAEFYHPNRVQSIYLEVAEKDRKRMLEALPRRVYVPASFRWRNVSIKKVAIRFKGNSSSNPRQRHKRSFLIRFDKYDPDLRFHGLQRVSFDNAIQFGSLFSEPIITEILRDQGIKVHRCNYAKLYLNNRYQGVYVNVERIDEVFIRSHFGNAPGALYKVDEGGPGSNLQYLGDDPRVYQRAFEAKNSTAEKERAKLVELLKLIGQPKKEEVAKKLASKMALDDFLRITAVLLFSGAFDQLTGWNPHNYYLFHDAQRDQWHYLPWDLDVGFCERAFGRIPVLEDWHAAWPVPRSGAPNPLLEHIIANPELLAKYRRLASEILDKYFEPKRLCEIIDAKYGLIKKDLQADPFPHRRVTNPRDRDYDDIVKSIKGFVRNRYAIAVKELKDPGKRPERVNRPGMHPPGLTPELVKKIRQIERHAREMRQKGEDIRPIQRLMERVGPLVRQGKSKEAEKILDEVLKLIGKNRPKKQ